MKVIWEAEDVRAGLHVRARLCNDTWMIGYDPTIKDAGWALISIIDGRICQKGLTTAEMAEFLNRNVAQPIELVGEKDD